MIIYRDARFISHKINEKLVILCVNIHNKEIMIRYGSLDDAAEVAEIYNHYVATSTVIFSDRQLSADEMRHKLGGLIDGEYPFLVAEDESGNVSGYCYAHAWQPDEVYAHSWEITIYVRSGCQGQGLGRALLGRLIDECRKRGAHTLISCITGGNDASCRLHEHFGFRKVSHFPEVGYKFGLWLDDVHYQLML